MSIQYTNRRGKTYYLHQGTTKTGKPKYFFAMKSEGQLVDKIPDGFEIYENPNAQVFLRRKRPKIISDEEVAIVEKGLEQFSPVRYYQIDVKKNDIIIFLADQDIDLLAEFLEGSPRLGAGGAKAYLVNTASYSPVLQFTLIDQERRLFITQRYCFLGSIDDWIEIGSPGRLPDLVKKYVQHLGQDSYYELY